MKLSLASLGLAALLAAELKAERINQQGRILGAQPVVTNAVLFNTAAGDAVVSAMQILPVTHPWNEDISRRPLLTNSAAMIAQIGADLLSTRQKLFLFQEMNYVLVPDSQPLVPVEFVDYPDESDLNGGTLPTGLYPVPPNLPIEGWPAQTSGQSLSEWQMNNDGSDRHSVIVQPGLGRVFETWQSRLTGGMWLAANGAIFDLLTNSQRPAGWTSGDAAGLAMFPALVRYDECERGMVEHACRLVVKRTRYRQYIYPATHFASSSGNTNVNLPAMGQRLRLKSDYVISSNWTRQEKALLLGLKKYGAIVADNGNFFSISITPDDRWPAGAFANIAGAGLAITNFEVIQTTGPSEGPRSPGAPIVRAGPDQAVLAGVPVTLQGAVDFVGVLPSVRWTLYAGAGPVVWSEASRTNGMITFNTPGTYTLMLSADDGVHAVAYDAVVISVAPVIQLSVVRTAGSLQMNWQGGEPPFVVERTAALFPPAWSGIVTTSLSSASVPLAGNSGFLRIRGP